MIACCRFCATFLLLARRRPGVPVNRFIVIDTQSGALLASISDPNTKGILDWEGRARSHDSSLFFVMGYLLETATGQTRQIDSRPGILKKAEFNVQKTALGTARVTTTRTNFRVSQDQPYSTIVILLEDWQSGAKLSKRQIKGQDLCCMARAQPWVAVKDHQSCTVFDYSTRQQMFYFHDLELNPACNAFLLDDRFMWGLTFAKEEHYLTFMDLQSKKPRSCHSILLKSAAGFGDIESEDDDDEDLDMSFGETGTRLVIANALVSSDDLSLILEVVHEDLDEIKFLRLGFA